MFVDWAGQTIPVVEKKTGETRPAYLFVAILSASNYTYAEVSMSMDLSSRINAHCRSAISTGRLPPGTSGRSFSDLMANCCGIRNDSIAIIF